MTQGQPRTPAWVFVSAVCVVLYAAAVPVGRSCLLTQVNYNEGWNVYNASSVANHQLLYGVRYGWTTVNYPALSFYILAWLHSVTHDYLFTARALSLVSTLLCGVFASFIVWAITRGRSASVLTGLFCVALFFADAEQYVAMADPQLLAQAFFMAGLMVYVRYRPSGWALLIVALLFVLGGNIKHSLLEFPLAVSVDLWLTSRRKAFLFYAFGATLAACSVALNIHYGGPYFLTSLLAGRQYSIPHIFDNLTEGYGPVLVPVVVAAIMAFRSMRDSQRRILALLFGASLLVSVFFGAGRGVWINVLFGGLLAVAMLVGLFLQDVEQGLFRLSPSVRAAVPVVMFAWLVIPMMVTGNWRPIRELSKARSARQRFEQEATFLARQDGSALCESLLLCFYAQKPYVYDPFNATRLIKLGRLDSTDLQRRIRQEEFAAIQMDQPIEQQRSDGPGSDRFLPLILSAVEENYTAAFENEDGVIYLPHRKLGK